jgi:hypothetical protein
MAIFTYILRFVLQMSGNSKGSVDEYSHHSVAFYSEPLQVVERDEEDKWRHHRGATTASTRIRASPSIDRLEGLRR